MNMLRGIIATFCLAFAPHVWAEPDLPSGATVAEAIDSFVDSVNRRDGIEAADQASETNLVRRLTLDLAGRIPATVEVDVYLASEDHERRAKLVDRLLATDEFSDYIATRFDWFITQGEGGIQAYLRTAFQENRGWDEMFRDILLADLLSNDEAIPYLKQRVKDSDQFTNEVSVTFFGVNISCAKCHDHPLVSDWTQDHFYGMKSFFDRTFDNGGFVAEREYGLVNYQTTDGEERQAPLMFLTGKNLALDDASEPNKEERDRLAKLFRESKKKKEPPPPPKLSLRRQLIDLALADGQNHFFARAVVNRIWYQFFGHGMVMPLDQMHSENPPSHPQLMDWLANDLISHGYDLRRLIRGIVMSQAYSRSSRWEQGDRPEPGTFAVAGVRPLTPTQLARSLSLATADQRTFEGSCGLEMQDSIAQAAATRLSDAFDQPAEVFQATANEALLFSNGDQFEKEYLSDGLVSQLRNTQDTERLIATAYWSVFSRAPSRDEAAMLAEYVDERDGDRDAAVRQLVWSLLASSEFRFNH